MRMYHIDTKCVQEGWKPKNGEPRILPIYQSTTFKYDSAQHLSDLFDLKAPGHFYTRLSNPTLEAVESKMASLEGGVAAMLTSSGQAASLLSIINIAGAGDHVISSSEIYGGTYNLFNVTMKKLGISFTFVDPSISDEDLRKEFKPNTKLIFAETVSNPSLNILDIKRFADIAHEHKIPLVVDNTFPTPINCRPIEFGADIVVHSCTKYLDGHAAIVGGAIIDSGNFDWAKGDFPGFTQPDDSYHGIIYTEAFGKLAYIVKARVQLMRDLGVQMAPNSGFLLNYGIETLHLRMERHCSNAFKVAEFLESHEKIAWVNYPGLKNNEFYDLAQKYMPNGTCGVITFGVKGGRENSVKFMDSLKLAAIVTHVADARTCVLHPASTTHRQLSDKQLEECGVKPDMVRFSVGIENPDDIISDIKEALDCVKI